MANPIEYLAFEGGGGKGIIYIGALKALELKINGAVGKPLVNPKLPAEKQKIKGISGSILRRLCLRRIEVKKLRFKRCCCNAVPMA